MKYFIILLSVVLVAGLFFSCESYKDPFSANNQAPLIREFVFKPDPTLSNISADSLKYRSGEGYLLHLDYEDPELGSSATATVEVKFKFINGSGEFSHDQFINSGGDGLTFTAPAKFNSDIFFTPDTFGRVRIEMLVSDGVKDSEAIRTSAVFFENLAPIPSFTATFRSNVSPYRVEFDPEASVDRDGEIKELVWTFGDGSPPKTVLNKSSITHEYTEAGQYKVRLRVTDNEGKADSTEQVISTNNQPPVAALRITPQAGQAPLDIEYNAGGSFDPDGIVSQYQISFDDGQVASDVSGKHTYTQDGIYQVMLTVKDNMGLADTTFREVQVITPPIALLTITPSQGSFPLIATIDASHSLDPFGGDLLYKIYIDGELTYTQSKVVHIFETPKASAYLVRLEVESQRNGMTNSVTESVFVTNTPPIADFTYTPQNPQRTVEITFTSTSVDPDSTDRITFYRWSWGDGSSEDTGSNLSSIIHKYTSSGTYLVKLEVTDRFGGVGSKEVQIEVK